MNLYMWPPRPLISTELLLKYQGCLSLWMEVTLNALITCMIMINDISKVSPKTMQDFCPSVLVADVPMPSCGKGFLMPVKFRPYRPHCFLCLKLHDCLFFVLFVSSYKSMFNTWAGCAIILKHPVHVEHDLRMILNASYDKCLVV